MSNEYAGAAADNGDAPVENEGHPSDRNVGLFPDSDDLEIIDEGDDIEIIYVQGTLSDSISRALQTKRYVIECPGITEDIGNLPDVSIADSIKRLPPRPPNE